jgi:hypothetical protein
LKSSLVIFDLSDPRPADPIIETLIGESEKMVKERSINDEKFTQSA